ncbi:hypothetical protein [Cellvibrio fibrivorans]|uniref:Apea-like HEPN domain-containing protein n=1 Tax=Cellvibrio fibrivorans TaxID=126350 RepID=A0ABU1V097_9GAMM|nr:hypothetical protein [Cellvibrio fibrivorans]MDR7090881.1 hypothetical protein [Cellvibrio fibrivorans]
MSHSVEITENTFFSIFSDAVLLYELASSETDKYTQNTLAKSSILSVNYALEAAANSFITSIEITSKLKSNIDKFSTLDKFELVLQWHKDKSLPRGERETQIIQKLIDQRNELVHPKVKTVQQDVVTALGDESIAYYHKALQDNSNEKCKVTKMSLDPSQYSAEDALIAIKSLVNFLNKYIESWWEIDVESSAILLMKSWTGSVQASPIMYQKHELEIVLRHNKNLNIRFVGLYGILEQFT